MKIIIVIRIINEYIHWKSWKPPGCHFALQMKCWVLCFPPANLPMSSLDVAASRRTRQSADNATRGVLKLVWTSPISDHHWRPHLVLIFLIAQRPSSSTYGATQFMYMFMLPLASFAFGLALTSPVCLTSLCVNLLANNRSLQVCMYCHE